MVILTSARSLRAASNTADLPVAGVVVGGVVGFWGCSEAVLQAVSMLTAMMPARAREAIFLSFIMIFSSLWCIKDRDPKQVERKVLSFQRHYSIPPPGVKARFTIFWFLLSFRYFGWKCEVYVLFVYAAILYVYSFCVGASGRFCAPLSVPAQSAGTPPPQGEASVPASIAAKFVVRQSRKNFILPQSFPLSTDLHLAPPVGELARSA